MATLAGPTHPKRVTHHRRNKAFDVRGNIYIYIHMATRRKLFSNAQVSHGKVHIHVLAIFIFIYILLLYLYIYTTIVYICIYIILYIYFILVLYYIYIHPRVCAQFTPRIDAGLWSHQFHCGCRDGGAIYDFDRPPWVLIQLKALGLLVRPTVFVGFLACNGPKSLLSER